MIIFTKRGWPAQCRHVLLLVSLWLLPQLVAAQAATATWQWATRAAGSANSPNDFSRGRFIKVDGAGNSFSAGDFRGTLRLGSTTLSSPGEYRSFLVKYTPTGAVAWVRHLNGTMQETLVYGLAVDAGGNSYVTGYYDGTLTVGSVTLTGGGGFLIKYDPLGTVLWARQAGHVFNGIACTAAGEVLAMGSFEGTAVFGSTTLTSPSMAGSGFLVKYSAQGSPVWARQFEGVSNDEGFVGLDGTGNIYIAADFEGTATFGSITLPGTASDEDVVVAKYNAAGTPQWALRQPVAGAPGLEHAWGLATDVAGNTYLVGSSQLAGSPDNRWFVSKYTPQGTISWNHLSSAAVIEYNALTNIAIDAASNVYVSGGIAGSFSIGGLTLSSSGASNTDLALLSFTTLGQPRWAFSTGAASAEAALGLALDAANNLYLTGILQGNVSLGSLSLPQNSPSLEQFAAKVSVSTVMAARATRALEQVVLYPNPTNGGPVKLRWPQLAAAPGRLLVRDAVGRCVLALQLPAGQPEALLPVQSLGRGVYTVHLETTNAVAAGRLVIE